MVSEGHMHPQKPPELVGESEAKTSGLENDGLLRTYLPLGLPQGILCHREVCGGRGGRRGHNTFRVKFLECLEQK